MSQEDGKRAAWGGTWGGRAAGTNGVSGTWAETAKGSPPAADESLSLASFCGQPCLDSVLPSADLLTNKKEIKPKC